MWINKIKGGKINRILANFALPHVAKILGILECFDYYVALGWSTPLQFKTEKEKFYLGLFKIVLFENWRFLRLGGFWVSCFQSIQQTKFILLRFCTKFCCHQHQNCEILPTNFQDIVWKLSIFDNLFFFTRKTSRDLRFLYSSEFYHWTRQWGMIWLRFYDSADNSASIKTKTVKFHLEFFEM